MEKKKKEERMSEGRKRPGENDESIRKKGEL